MFTLKRILYVLFKKDMNSSIRQHNVKPVSSDCKSNYNYTMIIFGVLGVMLIILFMFGCSSEGKVYFEKFTSKFKKSGNLKDMDVVMFMSPTCPHCVKMIEVIKKSGNMKNITIVDITKPEGQAVAKSFGADKQHVPSFISKKTRTGVVGYRDSINKLIDDLTPKEGQQTENTQPQGQGQGQGQGSSDIVSAVNKLQIALFSKEGCPWCQKAKENLNDAGVSDIIQVFDMNTEEGQQAAQDLLPPNSTGVPAYVSMTTKKHVIGFKPIDQVVDELQ